MSIRLGAWAAATLLASAAFGSFPLYFEENKGQTHGRVDFLSRGPGYVLFLEDGEAVLKLKDRAVRMSLPGASRQARAVGIDPLPGRSNYLRGGDGSRDVTGVAQYGKVRYQSVYPGIDLVYYGKDGRLEYDFVVAPGADPSKIRLRFEGARQVQLDRGGNLLVDDGVRFDKPVLYQEHGGKRVEIAGSFRLRGRETRFEVGPYRRDLPLIIDPVLTYSTYLGGSGDDQIKAIAVDGAGNAYVGGDTTSADFPASAGAYNTTLSNRDWFIAKLNPSGAAVVYATYIGAQFDEGFTDLDVTPDGRVIAVGNSGLVATLGAYNGGYFSTIVRLNPAGTGVEYIAKSGVYAAALKAATDGSALIAGIASADSQTTAGAFQRTRQAQDGYVLRLNAAGSSAVFATYLGGPGAESINDVDVDSAGDVYVTGTTTQSFPTTAGAYQTTGTGFVAKLKADGTALLYSTLIAGAIPQRVASGPGGDVWVSGRSQSAEFDTTAGAYLTTGTFYEMAFLLRLNATGTSAVYSTFTGGTYGASYASPVAVAVGSDGEAFVASPMTGPTTPNAFQPGQGGVYIQRFNAAGSILRYATYYGSTPSTFRGIALDGAGNLYVAGHTAATNIPTTPGALQTNNRGSEDGFVARIDNANVSCSYTLTPTLPVHTASAATATIAVAAGSGCSWIATAGASWIKIISGASGIGPGTLTYSLDPNHSTQPRAGILTIAGRNISITQLAAACTYAIAPASLAFDPAGGISNVAVTAPQGCSWTVLSNATWITPAVSNGNGDGVVPYTVTANSGYPRAGTLNIAGRTFTVTQGGPATPPPGSRFVPVTPCRVADTRNATGPFGAPEIAAGTSRSFAIPSSACGIPSTAVAYSFNVTVVPRGLLGILTVFPTGQTLPFASTLNSLDGRVKANAVIVEAGTDGAVNVLATQPTNVILDINGYFVPATAPSALAFYPLPPCRIADTRNSPGALGGPVLGAGQTRSIPVRASSCNVPATAQAYSLNFTAVPRGYLGHLTTWPTGVPAPAVSTLNAPTGQITANAAILPAGVNGDISVSASNETDLVIDINGYFAPPGAGGLSFHSLTPCRALDSRGGWGPFSGVRDANIVGSPCGVPPTAQAYVFNATVVPLLPLGHLTLWPNGQPQPLASTLNALDQSVTSNMAIVPTTNGSVNSYAPSSTHLVLDISGYFAP